jgi:hypothetical protein
VGSTRPRAHELATAARPLPEAAQNLAIVLEHLDDPRFATEADARAGRGAKGGYSGLESLLRYFYAQAQAINLFDANSYMLKATPFLDRDCASYTTVEAARDEARKRCHAWLGPNQPGVTSPDFTKRPGSRALDFLLSP